MAGAAAAMAGALMQARRRVIAHFESQGAVSADRAVPYAPEQRLDRQAFDQFLRNGNIISVGDDKWYFDLARYEAQQAEVSRNMLWVAAIALVAMGIAFLIRAFTS